ncbi:hypothetical protein HDU93_007855 [Gonapodya sp. JEL0774]|nr:hypothetical protein HDU93_007855 [Gonapodya sp. JEL0774]
MEIGRLSFTKKRLPAAPIHLSASFTVVDDPFPVAKDGSGAIAKGMRWSRFIFAGTAIGTGGQADGAIQLATIAGSGTNVAIKRRSIAELVKSSSGAENFVRESVIGKVLGSHPNVSRVVEALVSRESAVLVTEFVENAVTHFNHHGLSHNDVKPDNILVQMNSDLTPSKAVLIDPGVGHIFTSSTRAVPTGQSPPYTPPEVIEALADTSSQATVDCELWDVYSMGRTVYEVLRALRLDCGLDVEANEEMSIILERTMGSSSFAHLVAKMTDPNPANRFSLKMIWDDNFVQKLKMQLQPFEPRILSGDRRSKRGRRVNQDAIVIVSELTGHCPKKPITTSSEHTQSVISKVLFGSVSRRMSSDHPSAHLWRRSLHESISQQLEEWDHNLLISESPGHNDDLTLTFDEFVMYGSINDGPTRDRVWDILMKKELGHSNAESSWLKALADDAGSLSFNIANGSITQASIPRAPSRIHRATAKVKKVISALRWQSVRSGGGKMTRDLSAMTLISESDRKEES